MFLYTLKRHVYPLILFWAVFVPAQTAAEPTDRNAVETVAGRVGFAQDTLANDWRLMQVKDVENGLADYPDIEFTVTDGQGSIALQAQQIRELADSVDVLITSPRSEAVLSEIISRIDAQGTPVILLSRGIQGDSYTSFVHGQNELIGQQAGEFIGEVINGTGNVLMLQGVPGASVTTERTQGFMAAMAAYPDIQVVTRVANYLRADSIRAVREVLDNQVAFEAIFAQSDSMAEGARMALTQAGIDPSSLPIVGIDYIRSARDALLSGQQSLSFTYPTGGQEGAELAVRLLKGETVPKRVEVPFLRVSPSNATDIEPIF
ncbi:MAG: substrate-binding domain-containing protein [Pseudomonadota bacterium]